MTLNFTLSAAGIMLVSYLYLLVRWQHVKRPLFYMIGAGTFLITFLGGIFSCILVRGGAWPQIIGGVLSTVGALAAFACAFLACYAAKLPTDQAEETPAAETR